MIDYGMTSRQDENGWKREEKAASLERGAKVDHGHDDGRRGFLLYQSTCIPLVAMHNRPPPQVSQRLTRTDEDETMLSTRLETMPLPTQDQERGQKYRLTVVSDLDRRSFFFFLVP